MMSRYLSKSNTVINDEAILKDMDKAKEMYEDGELLEAADLMQKIARAIKAWKGPVNHPAHS